MEQISTFQSIMNGFDFSRLVELISGVVPALICITFHELCHGFTAYLLGDDTAKRAGRLTLNPIKHIDLYGLAMMAIFHVGWAKPVPVNMYKFKNPKRGMAITALAGPVSNMLLAVLFLFLYGFLYIPLKSSSTGSFALQLIGITVRMNIGLAVFNLIPVPPLDGSKVLFSVISDEMYAKLMRYEKYGMIVLVVLVFSGILGNPVSSAVSWLFDKMFVIAQTAFNLYKMLM